jgi:hypothetical protein
MIRSCEKCGRILVAAPDPETFQLRMLPCQCGYVRPVAKEKDKPGAVAATTRSHRPRLAEAPR